MVFGGGDADRPAGDVQPGQHAISQYELMKQQLQQQQQTFGFGSAYGAPQQAQQQQFPHAALPSFQPLGFDSFGQQVCSIVGCPLPPQRLHPVASSFSPCLTASVGRLCFSFRAK